MLDWILLSYFFFCLILKKQILDFFLYLEPYRSGVPLNLERNLKRIFLIYDDQLIYLFIHLFLKKTKLEAFNFAVCSSRELTFNSIFKLSPLLFLNDVIYSVLFCLAQKL